MELENNSPDSPKDPGTAPGTLSPSFKQWTRGFKAYFYGILSFYLALLLIMVGFSLSTTVGAQVFSLPMILLTLFLPYHTAIKVMMTS